ncbi:hypothetical protein ARMGADRAFT_1071021 [Armillaria gallica]|uniref:Uncharacterized protein n=1 Tax=Armillaria gallica TaxID=47427 RepID=A0A2H3EZ68_ARMGA|nr:hypothetical protein ARMGADRAFT_1071021 [Armillaria gallica]
MFQSDFSLTVMVLYLETGAEDLFSLAWWQYQNSGCRASDVMLVGLIYMLVLSFFLVAPNS